MRWDEWVGVRWDGMTAVELDEEGDRKTARIEIGRRETKRD